MINETKEIKNVDLDEAKNIFIKSVDILNDIGCILSPILIKISEKTLGTDTDDFLRDLIEKLNYPTSTKIYINNDSNVISMVDGDKIYIKGQMFLFNRDEDGNPIGCGQIATVRLDYIKFKALTTSNANKKVLFANLLMSDLEMIKNRLFDYYLEISYAVDNAELQFDEFLSDNEKYFTSEDVDRTSSLYMKKIDLEDKIYKLNDLKDIFYELSTNFLTEDMTAFSVILN